MAAAQNIARANALPQWQMTVQTIGGKTVQVIAPQGGNTTYATFSKAMEAKLADSVEKFDVVAGGAIRTIADSGNKTLLEMGLNNGDRMVIALRVVGGINAELATYIL